MRNIQKAEEAIKRAMWFLRMPNHDHLVGRELHEAWKAVRRASQGRKP